MRPWAVVFAYASHQDRREYLDLADRLLPSQLDSRGTGKAALQLYCVIWAGRCPIFQCQQTVGTSLIGDRDRLGQVFTNLLSNAIKYSPRATTVEMDLFTSEEAVRIRVRDYGTPCTSAEPVIREG